MKHFSKTVLLAGSLLAALPAFASSAHGNSMATAYDFRYKSQKESAFSGKRASQIERINKMFAGEESRMKEAAEPQPDFQYGPSNLTGTLDAPGGKTWYYTGDFTYDFIPVNEYFTDKILKHYLFKVYDENGEFMGAVEDDMHYTDDEKRVVSCDLVPIVSRNFYNTDDLYEVAVGLGINSITPGLNHYRTVAYQLGGETGENGYNKIINTIPSLVGDMVQGPDVDGRDNFFITFTEDVEPDYSDDNMSFWDMLTQYKIRATTYGRAEDNAAGPVPLLVKEFQLLNLPGDQQNVPFLMTTVHNDKVYLVYQTLREPLWESYESPMDQPVQREGNFLDVQFYTATPTEIAPLYTTSIAVETKGDDNIYATYYSIGNLRYRGDILFGEHGAPADKAALIVCVEDYFIQSDSALYAYCTYDYEGKKLFTIAENTESNLSMSDIEGFEPQQLFISFDGSTYQLSFVNLTSGKTAFTMSNYIDEENGLEPQSIVANIDRTPVGDSYEYAVEYSTPLEYDPEHIYMQIGFLKADGSYSHTEYVDMGTNVQYAKSYIECNALKPGAFTTDGNRAMLVLIKRGIGGSALTEELLVGETVNSFEEAGKTILLLTPNPEKGNLQSIFPDFYSEVHNLSIYWVGEKADGTDALTLDIYKLPFDTSAVKDIATDSTADGVIAGDVTVYTVSGAVVAKGEASSALRSLAAGVYIVKTGDKAHKILVK